jgi:competence protein ComEC
MPLVGAVGWAGGLVGLHTGSGVIAAGMAAGLAVGVVLLLILTLFDRCKARQRGPRRCSVTTTSPRATALACVLVFAALASAAILRQQSIAVTPVADLAREHAFVRLAGVISSDPRTYDGTFAEFVVVRFRITELKTPEGRYRLSTPVVVMADENWANLRLGSRVRFDAIVTIADHDHDVAAIVRARGTPDVVAPPALWWRGADRVRRALRASVAHRPVDQRALVPALVVGDDEYVDESLSRAFAATGLTHLLAVSGTNLTLLVGFLLIASRWCGVRGRGLYGVGAIGIVGFVLLARLEPSVVRAAAMGTVGLLGMGVNGRQRGGRALGAAVLVVLLVDPLLADSPGFALSVLATGAIVYLAPGWRDALARWLPRWLAEAIAVPAAAQLVCTPLVAAISGQVSVVAVAANLLAAPAVGPATVLGLAGGFVGLVSDSLARIPGTVAAWCAGWIVLIARRGADLPTPGIPWATNLTGLMLLSVLCLAAALIAPRLLGRRVVAMALSAVVAIVVLTRLPTPGWPPPQWVFAACDVGQGDALVLNAGKGDAVVVDAGPDPVLVDRCLQRLDVTRVPLLILTHFHADHVDGLAGVIRGRQIGAIETTTLKVPVDRARAVEEAARQVGVVPSPTPYGATQRVGRVLLQHLWPAAGRPGPAVAVAGDEDGEPNNASVVVLAEVAGVRILLTGDIEPFAQAGLARTVGRMRVDVLKVPHHGSRFQDFDFLAGLHPQLAVISAGADNDYGHPAPKTLSTLTDAGVRIGRTDQDGDVVVIAGDDSVALTARNFSDD